MLVWPLAGVAASEARPQAPSLPPGGGRPLVLEACVQCHDLRAVVSQRKTAQAWRRSVNEMIWRGAPLLPGEADTLARYLAEAFGPVGRVSAAAKSSPKTEGPAAQASPRTASPVARSSPSAASSAATDAFARYLPPGPGRALVLKACVECHDLRTTVAVRKTPGEWRRSVEQMARLGAPLNGLEVDVVAQYLGRAFGPGDPLPDALREPGRQP